MPRAWISQDNKQVKKYGSKKASFYVNWLDPDGKRKCKSCGSGTAGRTKANHLKRKIEAELIEGTYGRDEKKKWEHFIQEYKESILPGMADSTQVVYLYCIDHFQRIVNPKQVKSINTQMIDKYISRRKQEDGLRKGDKVSAATINKELRHIKAVVKIAHEWGYLPAVPRFRMMKEPEKLPTYVTPEHFTAIYNACKNADTPEVPNLDPETWWQSFLTTMYMTGWRVSEVLSLRREDIDFESCCMITRHQDNKSKREERTLLHAAVIEHMKLIQGFDDMMFPWPYGRRQLWRCFHKIQESAGIHLPCREEHEHTDTCHVYGFHDLRRAFATNNEALLTPNALQGLMRHRTWTTTQRYINMAQKLNAQAETIYVPDVLKKG